MALLLDHVSIARLAGLRGDFEADIPDDATEVSCRLARQTATRATLWSAGVLVSVQWHVSLDGGATWLEGAGFVAPGGVHVRSDAVEAAESGVRSALPEGVGRKIRVEVNARNGQLDSELTLEVFP